MGLSRHFLPRTLRNIEVVHATRVPLLALHRYELELEPRALASAREELLGAATQPADGNSFRCGFLLGVEADPAAHSACLGLAEELRESLLNPQLLALLLQARRG